MRRVILRPLLYVLTQKNIYLKVFLRYCVNFCYFVFSPGGICLFCLSGISHVYAL